MSRTPIGTKIYRKGLCYYASPDVRGSSTRDAWKPQAINFNGNVYFAWVDFQGDIYCAKFQSGGDFGVGYLVATRALDYSSGSDIEHSIPSVCIDSSGYIYLFYGAHDSNTLYVRKSTNPEDVTTWNAKVLLSSATQAGYPQPIITSNDKIWVFYRQRITDNQKKFCFVTSTDGGVTWSSQSDLIAPTTDYWVYPDAVAVGSEVGTKSIHVFTSLRDSGGGGGASGFPFPNYCATFDGGTTWKKADGSTLTLPITELTCDTIASGSCYPGDMKLNSLNKPYIVYTINGGTVKFAKWSGSAWVLSTVSTVATYTYEVAEIDIISDDIIDVYTVAGTTSIQGGDIQRYRSINAGGTWALAEQITNDATTTARYYFPKVVKDNDGLTKIIYMYGDPSLAYSFVNTRFIFKTFP